MKQFLKEINWLRVFCLFILLVTYPIIAILFLLWNLEFKEKNIVISKEDISFDGNSNPKNFKDFLIQKE